MTSAPRAVIICTVTLIEREKIMAYMNQERKKQLAPGIKSVLNKYGVKGSIAVRDHMVLVVNLKSGAVDFQKDYTGEGAHHYQINPYWFEKHYTGKAKKFLQELLAAMRGNLWYDNSDAMVDYFDTAYYMDVNVGQWNKEYEVTA